MPGTPISIEQAGSLTYDPLRQTAELPLGGTFYPFGFPVAVETNSPELLEAAHPALPAVLRCLGDVVPAVRAAAALTLARIKAPAGEAVPALVRALDDSETEVHLNAAIALSAFKRSAASAARPRTSSSTSQDPTLQDRLTRDYLRAFRPR